jgi:hypothetical protein
MEVDSDLIPCKNQAPTIVQNFGLRSGQGGRAGRFRKGARGHMDQTFRLQALGLLGTRRWVCRTVISDLNQPDCSRSRQRAEKVDKRMVLVHTHGLFIT